jgi:hypothetical protein
VCAAACAQACVIATACMHRLSVCVECICCSMCAQRGTCRTSALLAAAVESVANARAGGGAAVLRARVQTRCCCSMRAARRLLPLCCWDMHSHVLLLLLPLHVRFRARCCSVLVSVRSAARPLPFFRCRYVPPPLFPYYSLLSLRMIHSQASLRVRAPGLDVCLPRCSAARLRARL